MFEKELVLMASLRKLYKTMDDALSRNLKEQGISTMDYLILSILNDTGPILMQELREYVLISSGSITYATDRIIKKGLIKKVQDDEDKRKYFVELTNDGHNFLTQVDNEHLPYIGKLLSSLSGQQLDEITETISNLRDSVEKNK